MTEQIVDGIGGVAERFNGSCAIRVVVFRGNQFQELPVQLVKDRPLRGVPRPAAEHHLVHSFTAAINLRQTDPALKSIYDIDITDISKWLRVVRLAISSLLPLMYLDSVGHNLPATDAKHPNVALARKLRLCYYSIAAWFINRDQLV